jgi:hypothetical protein
LVDHYVNKRAKAFVELEPTLAQYRSKLINLEYVRVINSGLIYQTYKMYIHKTAGHPYHEGFTNQNLTDLYKLKVERAKDLRN